MQFSAIFALFAATALAGTVFERDCNIVPACNGGNVVGQTDCRCSGQAAPCDAWFCPDPNGNNNMVCGQGSTGCVFI